MADRKPGFANPRVHVIMADGAEWEAQTLNPDLLRFEATAGKHKWTGPSESPMRWLTFLAWRAGLREGHIPSDLSWEEFSENGPRLAMEVSNPDNREVDPIQPGADTD
jgi:hypothetical protein